MTLEFRAEAIVAGHICLDIIPDLSGHRDLAALMQPGKLHQIKSAIVSTGGVVSNTGLSLHRLGIATKLMGKVGDDAFGLLIRQHLAAAGEDLAKGMVIAQGDHSSYTLVISPPGADRTFLHYPGTNDTFCADDIGPEQIAGAKLFHFGYPPIMRRIYNDGGANLEAIFRRGRTCGLTTSLDMVQIDPRSDAARVDWPAYLRRVLPHVDLFLPSLDEILSMLADIFPDSKDESTLSRLSDLLLSMGAAVVGLKLGDAGLYVRTTKNRARLLAMGACGPKSVDSWLAREILSPCFEVDVAGTTGAGDATIAGFLAGLLRSLPVEQVATAAVGTGAHCVEKPDATSGVPSWDVLQRRIGSGWKRKPLLQSKNQWRLHAESGVYFGPNDGKKI